MTLLSLKLTLISITVLLLASCFGGGASIPDDHYYRLPELSGEKITEPILKGTLSIKKVTTHGIYSERTLIYTDTDNNIGLNRYHYHFWEKSPSELVQDNMMQYLKSTGVASKVILYNQNITANYILESDLIAFHRDLTSNKFSAVITLDIRIYDSSNNSIRINKRYYSKINSHSNKLIDTIKAYSEGFKNIYNELLSDLQSLDT